jgi:hypothetical protein
VKHTGATEHVYESHSIDIIISSQLLDLIDHEGVRRFVIHAGQSDGILVSDFTPFLADPCRLTQSSYGLSTPISDIQAQVQITALHQDVP